MNVLSEPIAAPFRQRLLNSVDIWHISAPGQGIDPSLHNLNTAAPFLILHNRHRTPDTGHDKCRQQSPPSPRTHASSVSWIRHRDLHILTVGGYTYTSDQRFQATHSPHTDDWTLQVKWAQQRDAGVYECQVSTQPVRSFFVTLHVVDCDEIYQRMFSDAVPSARILGGPDLHVDIGSTINLTCLIQFSPEPPAYIFWYHEDEVSGRKVISYDSSRGGVSVVTEKGAATTSYLLVQDAAPADSGRYSCSPSNAEVASVRVHVLNGERPAAMQTGSAGLSDSWGCLAVLLAAAALHARLLRAALAS
ncbi:hypothetical protein RR46_02746 [Papilio xuthus]|uniref:Ig-like domain-containing protein n=1 Tax=Papilio xuthus TaxID=66420 RepID=A0A194Q491_PAPXU|nr:hypothetical protein RR46_02746 [Papilio xuthus]